MRLALLLAPLALIACATTPGPIETVTIVRDWIWPPPVPATPIAPLEAPAISVRPVVTVTVRGLKSTEGLVRVGLFKEAAWAGDPAFSAEAPVIDGAAQLTLHAPTPGRYALKIYHDLNNDGGLNRAAYGMPTEPYGFSNSADGRFGPPAFDVAAFEVTADGATQTVTLK
jgi:uncharacterized protein (DUF2141 family)